MKMTVYVKATAEIAEPEKMNVDIFLFDRTNDSFHRDIGSDSVAIVPSDAQHVLVDRGLLLALIDTVRRTTDLRHVYDDNFGTSYRLDRLDDYVKLNF
jgi:hypothetical protein